MQVRYLNQPLFRWTFNFKSTILFSNAIDFNSESIFIAFFKYLGYKIIS